jgi:hypothetical protein
MTHGPFGPALVRLDRTISYNSMHTTAAQMVRSSRTMTKEAPDVLLIVRLNQACKTLCVWIPRPSTPNRITSPGCKNTGSGFTP